MKMAGFTKNCWEVAWSKMRQIMVKLIFQKIDFLKPQRSFF